ncbi:Polymerase/histidinol phosphatase-like protein [Cyathus striatus]|nr:Polymerase/histidinol phosphatase-like protein [Cyathus striatus]
MPHSHHSHSGQFCKHATGLLEDIVLEAIRQGFNVFGLTEHVPRYRLDDLYPEEEGLSLEYLMKQFEDFLEEAHRLKRKYALQISLLVGLETEYITQEDLDGLDILLKRLGDRIEYVVGSVHHVNTIPIDFDNPTFEKARISLGGSTEKERQQAYLEAYFDAQLELLQRFQPEIVGHIDLCRLYTPDIRFVEYSSIWERIERNIKYAVGYGALFEVNAAAFRKGWDSAYPAHDAILKHAGRLALSDDSHGPHAVGLNYDRTFDYLRAEGVEELWYLQPSEISNTGRRKVSPVKMAGNWWEDSFWDKRYVAERT